MPIDYSKWDKIELSDDSDIEVHPNVDKRSFIRWKQQSIHEEREKRNVDIKNLEVQIEMYGNLNKRVDKLLNKEDFPVANLAKTDEVTKFLNANFDKTEKMKGDNVDPDIGTFNEMVEDLFEQLQRDALKESKDPRDGNVIKQLLLQHRQKIDKVTNEAKTKLDELYLAKSNHISSDDYRTGFDSGFMNTKSVEEDTQAMQDALKKVDNKNHVADTDLNLLPKDIPLQFIDFQDDVTKLAPETEQFGSINFKNYKESEAYLVKHMQIISEQQKDALMMKAFEYELSEKGSPETYQVIHQSELLGYVREVYDLKKIPFLNVDEMKNVIEMFFQRVIYNPANQKGRESFLESVKQKYDHVKKRVEIIQQEQAEEGEGVETIQLKSLDDSTELEINLPDFSSSDPAEIAKKEAFLKLPKEMQDAVKTQNLDTINKVFENIPIEEAEAILDLFNEAELIGVRALLENENEFNQIKEEYQNQNKVNQSEETDLKTLTINEEEKEHVNTADIVD